MPKLLVLGGVESVPYSDIGYDHNVRVDYMPHIKKVNSAKVGNYNAVICLTAQLSHSMVKGVKKLASKNKVPVHYLHSSSKTKFTCFLQDFCNRNCPCSKRAKN